MFLLPNQKSKAFVDISQTSVLLSIRMHEPKRIKEALKFFEHTSFRCFTTAET